MLSKCFLSDWSRITDTLESTFKRGLSLVFESDLQTKQKVTQLI